MKSIRTPQLVLATAVLATASLLLATPASAATTIGDGTFYDASDFGVEGTSYPAGVDWFFGDVTGTEGPHSFGIEGLQLNGDQSGNVQILNQNVGTQPTSAADLIDIVENFWIDSDDDTKWALQLAFFGEGASSSQFTTLYPNDLGNLSGPAAASTWYTTGALGSYGAGTTATLQELADELFVDEAPTMLAYGAYVVNTNTAVIRHVEWRGEVSLFVPMPTRAISTTSITPADASTTGFTLTGTNWRPGSDVYVWIDDPDGNGVFNSMTTVADSSGNVSFAVVLPAPVELGAYEVTFDDDGYFFGLDVMSSPFTTLNVVAAQLAETGASESGPYFAGAAGILAILGLSAIVVSRRRMQKI